MHIRRETIAKYVSALWPQRGVGAWVPRHSLKSIGSRARAHISGKRDEVFWGYGVPEIIFSRSISRFPARSRALG